MLIGRVDEVDGHFVATRFIALLIPVSTVYVSTVTRASRPDDGAVRRDRSLTPLRLDWQSVGLGYARVWAPVLALALPLVQIAAGRFSLAPWIFTMVLVGVWFASHKIGRLPEREEARLRLLGTVTGLRVDPSRLRESTRSVKCASLGDLMDKGGIPLSASEILAVLEDIPMPALALVYGYARYAGDDPAWRACADAVYARHEQGEL